MEVLRNVATTIRFPEVGADSVALTSPKVTIVRDSDGSTAVSEATPTKVEPEGGSTYWTQALTAAQTAALDILTATWKSSDGSLYTQTIEVVGGFVASLAEIKDRLDETPADALVASKRESALKEIEDACSVALRPRYQKELLSGDGSRKLRLSRRRLISVESVSVDGTALTEAELEALTLDPMGVLISESAWSRGVLNIVVTYTHGFVDYPPARHPVRDYATYLLTPQPTDLNARATSVTTDVASYVLVTPGVRGARFPLPSVNAFVAEFGAPLVR